jgi:hypothetical protein
MELADRQIMFVHLSTGAFYTGRLESLYVESGEPPLFPCGGIVCVLMQQSRQPNQILHLRAHFFNQTTTTHLNCVLQPLYLWKWVSVTSCIVMKYACYLSFLSDSHVSHPGISDSDLQPSTHQRHERQNICAYVLPTLCQALIHLNGLRCTPQSVPMDHFFKVQLVVPSCMKTISSLTASTVSTVNKSTMCMEPYSVRYTELDSVFIINLGSMSSSS